MSSAANPRAPSPSEEGREAPGPIAADSLAAESLQSSGGFAENKHAEALGVQGSHSTLATTDTSGATALHAAPSGAVREQQDIRAAGPDERGATGLKLDALERPEFEGRHSLQGYVGGPSANASASAGTGSAGVAVKTGDSDFGASGVSSGAGDKVDSNVRSTGADFEGSSGGSSAGGSGSTAGESSLGGGAGPAAGTGVRPHVDAAPTYAGIVTGSALPEGTFKPKGEHLDDADVSNSIPQTKTFTGDVGGVHDPGRLAERAFEGQNTDPNPGLTKGGGDPNTQRTTTAEGRGGQYDSLGSERA